MKYSICNIHLLPKAADLRKEAFDEFPLNMAIVLQLLSRNALITFLGWLPVHSSFPGSLCRMHANQMLRNFTTLHNLVQSETHELWVSGTIQREFVLVFFAVDLNIFVLMWLEKVCHSVIYCAARPIKVILQVLFIHEFTGWIIQLNINQSPLPKY